MSIATPLTAPPQRYSVVNWITCIVMVLFHVGAVAALFHFSWTLLFVSAALYWVAVGFGISLGYHRLHTHRSYQVPKWLDYFFAVCGTLTLEGGPIFWVATHRIHHQHSDTDSDPHTPKHGGFWAHMGWILFGEGHHNKTRRAREVRARPRGRPLLSRAQHVSLGAADRAWASSRLAHRRMARRSTGSCSFASSWACTRRGSSTPRRTCGARGRFDIKDDSKNSWWVALITFGEGWHNNHHAHPTSARHGLAWYELDVSWITIRMMRAIGLAKRVRVATADGYVRKEAA